MRNLKKLKTGQSSIVNNSNRVDLEDAIRRIERWQAAYGSMIPTKAFFINLSDLIALIEEVLKSDLSAVGIRAYLGIREEANALGEVVPINELLLVASVLKVNANDISSIENPLLTVTDSIDYIYDLTSPCPPMCDMKSDLFKAGTVPLKKIALKDLKKTGNKKATAKKQVKK